MLQNRRAPTHSSVSDWNGYQPKKSRRNQKQFNFTLRSNCHKMICPKRIEIVNVWRIGRIENGNKVRTLPFNPDLCFEFLHLNFKKPKLSLMNLFNVICDDWIHVDSFIVWMLCWIVTNLAWRFECSPHPSWLLLPMHFLQCTCNRCCVPLWKRNRFLNCMHCILLAAS